MLGIQSLGPRFRGDERILQVFRGVRHDMEDGRMLYVRIRLELHRPPAPPRA
jgi:hypothetical protein